MRLASDNTKQREIINAKEYSTATFLCRSIRTWKSSWTPVWSLTHKVFVTSRLNTATLHPSPENQSFCVGCSNGNAAGNTLEEAMLARFLWSWIERDSVALWWYNCSGALLWFFESFDEPYLGKLRDFL